MMKKTMLIALTVLFACGASADNKLRFKSANRSSLEIAPAFNVSDGTNENTGSISEPEPEPEPVWGVDFASGQNSFTATHSMVDVTNSCYKDYSNSRAVFIGHGANWCRSELYNNEKGAVEIFDIQPGEDFVLSMDIRRWDYGSNISSHVGIIDDAYQGGTAWLINWSWHMSNPNNVKTIDAGYYQGQPVNEWTTYKLSKSSGVLTLSIGGSVVHSSEFEFTEAFNGRLAMSANNSSVNISNLVFKKL